MADENSNEQREERSIHDRLESIERRLAVLEKKNKIKPEDSTAAVID